MASFAIISYYSFAKLTQAWFINQSISGGANGRNSSVEIDTAQPSDNERAQNEPFRVLWEKWMSNSSDSRPANEKKNQIGDM